MKKESRKMGKVAVIAIIFGFVSINCLTAATKKKDESKPMATAVEGNLDLYVNKGDSVKKGQLLFYVESNEVYPAEYKKAKHDMRLDKITYQRKLKLNKRKIVSTQELQDALKKFTEDVDQMNFFASSIEHGHYYAPFDGVITDTFYLDGSGIGDGNAVLNIQKI